MGEEVEVEVRGSGGWKGGGKMGWTASSRYVKAIGFVALDGGRIFEAEWIGWSRVSKEWISAGDLYEQEWGEVRGTPLVKVD